MTSEQAPAAQRDYYDAYWSPGGGYPGGGLPPQLETALSRHLDGRPDCLDFGCGDGRAAGTWIAERAGSYVGFDISEVAVARAREAGLDARTLESEASLPVGDGSFDLAVSIEVFEHLTAPHLAAAEIARALRPGGVLIATTPNVAYWRRRLDLAVFGRWNPIGDELSVEQPWRDPHLRFFNRGSLARMLAGAGFADVGVGGHDGALLADLPLLRRLSRRRGSPPYRLLERLAPGLFSNRLLAVAVRS